MRDALEKLNHVLKMNRDVMTNTGVVYVEEVILELKQLEQQAKSIDELQKLVKDAADYLDINSQTVISNSSILHREFRSLANKFKTNKAG